MDGEGQKVRAEGRGEREGGSELRRCLSKEVGRVKASCIQDGYRKGRGQ